MIPPPVSERYMMKQGRPLHRKTPLRRKPWNYRPRNYRPTGRSKRGPRVHAATGMAKDPIAVPADVKAAVYARAGGKCDWCGNVLGDRWDPHHRQLKSRGGKHTLECLTALHRHCHDWVTVHPAEAQARGFEVHSWEDPAEIPVLLSDGRVCLPGTAWVDVEEAS